MSTCLINHDSVSLSSRSSFYASTESEKKGRAIFKSTLERFLSHQKVVIVDYLNSIKGFRYEMWCRARECQTQYCTVYCDTPIDECAKWNSARPAAEQYDEKIFIDLCQRMEAPNADKRWDAPLFTITPSMDTPLAALTSTLAGLVPSINPAVIPTRMEDSNYLHDLDRITIDVATCIVERQQDGRTMVGDTIAVPHTSKKIVLIRKIHLPEIRRLQNQYLKMAKMRTPESIEAIAATFVEHINICIKQQQTI